MVNSAEGHWPGVRGIAVALLLAVALPAGALEAPSDKVVLTITGPLAAPNDHADASFDLALLRTLPQQSFSTRTPWYAKPRKFTGVRLRDLLEAVGAPPHASVQAVALNGYHVEIPAEDIASGNAMLAYQLDDRPMPVRKRGPLLIIYPFDGHPELRTAVLYGRAIWQLRRLEVR
jgi:hypothetical protein